MNIEYLTYEIKNLKKVIGKLNEKLLTLDNFSSESIEIREKIETAENKLGILTDKLKNYID